MIVPAPPDGWELLEADGDPDVVTLDMLRFRGPGGEVVSWPELAARGLVEAAQPRERKLSPQEEREFEQKHPRQRTGEFAAKGKRTLQPRGRKPSKRGEPRKPPTDHFEGGPRGGRALTPLHVLHVRDVDPATLIDTMNQWQTMAHVPMPRGDLDVGFSPAGQGFVAYAWFDTARVRFDLTAMADYPVSGLREVYYHEVGHLYEWAMPQTARAEFLAILGLPPETPWRTGNPPPSELFAEAYAWAAMGELPDGRGTYGYNGTREQQQRVTDLLNRVGPLDLRIGQGTQAPKRVPRSDYRDAHG